MPKALCCPGFIKLTFFFGSWWFLPLEFESVWLSCNGSDLATLGPERIRLCSMNSVTYNMHSWGSGRQWNKVCQVLSNAVLNTDLKHETP